LVSNRLEEIASRESAPAAASGVELVTAATLKPEPIRWLWPGWLAGGKLHILAGAPGTGKTTLAMELAACVSTPRAFPSASPPPKGSVIIWSGEDDATDTLTPRLIAAGADLSHVHFIRDAYEDGKRYPFDPSRDVGKLAAAAARLRSVSLIVMDPLVSAISGDSHKNAEVRRGLAPLVELAERLNAALLGIMHYSKGTQDRDPLERVSGSIAFGGQARIVLGTVRQQSTIGSGHDMMVARVKSNISPDGGGFRYAFEQVELPEHGGLTASRIVWGSAVEGTARDLLAEPEADKAQHDERNSVGAWLRDLLSRGPLSANDVYRDAEGAGFSRHQVKRAKSRLRVRARKLGMDGGWVWEDEGGSEGDEEVKQTSPNSSASSGRPVLPSACVRCAGESCAHCTPCA
jgi:RecA-family ATPase